MTTIIKIENLSKKYVIGHQRQESYSTLRDVMMHKIRGIGERLRHPLSPNREKTTLEEFWALKDINLEIKQGDRVGIIGRNGAGKSTLLKILSRITDPTTGKVKIAGRVASLLEVGTGFHPELTGRENIFLNGAILGMSRVDIKKNFDEIVAFAEVEKFLDTPVKRYSSGMYVRLAFAVAAHLEPEILIVDEVLAVGDAQFQKKCLGKMEDIGSEGRTVLFVSHNMGSIARLCGHCILLNNGKITREGSVGEVIDYYLDEANNQIEKNERKNPIDGNHFESIYMSDQDFAERNSYRFDENIFIKLGLNLPEFNESLELAMRLIDRNKRPVFTIHEQLQKYFDDEICLNLFIKIPNHFLVPGKYSWVICINHPGVRYYDLHDDILPFTVSETGSNFARYEGMNYGCVFVNHTIRKV